MRRHRVRWTRVALRDLESALKYIGLHDPAAAEALRRRIRTAVSRLARLPELGRVVPERRAQGIREVFVQPYRVVYAIAGGEVHVLRLWHHRRDLTSA